MYTVADVLARTAVTIARDATVDEALAAWLRGGGHDLPVLQGGRLVGLLGARELLLARQRPAARIAGDLMRGEVRTVGLHTPLRKAAELLVGDGLGCLPVIDHDGSLFGVLTGADLSRFALEVITDLDKAADGLRVEERAARQADETGDEPAGDSVH